VTDEEMARERRTHDPMLYDGSDFDSLFLVDSFFGQDPPFATDQFGAE
jgi:hypothetical protein